MATYQYTVPSKYNNYSIRDIHNDLLKSGLGTGLGSLGTVANFLGVGETDRLKAGQTLTANLPGQYVGNSSEYIGLNKAFQPYTPSVATTGGKTTEDVIASQKEEEQAFMDALNAKVASQETLSDASTRIGGELGLPGLRESAQDLVTTLENIPETQKTISKQVGISAPNLEKRIASEQGKIAPRAQKAVSQQQFAETELGNRLGYLLQDQAKELEPFYQAALPLLSDRLAREFSGYTQDKQNELSVLLTRMSQDFNATQNDLDRANRLAIAEKSYNQTKNSQSIQTIGGRKVLVTYDNDGNVIAQVDLGPSSSGTGNKPSLDELFAGA